MWGVTRVLAEGCMPRLVGESPVRADTTANWPSLALLLFASEGGQHAETDRSQPRASCAPLARDRVQVGPF